MLSKWHNSFILRKVLFFVLPLVPALLFFVFIGYFNFLEYNAYQYTQFDLGVGYRTLYNFHATYHLYNWPVPPIETPQTFSKLIYVPLSFSLFIYNSPLILLFDQIALISIGGVAIFGISKRILGDFWLSIILELVYFLYPSTYGFMEQGGNFMVFFEPLLLIGYYFYIRGRSGITAILFLLASISNAFAPAILLILLGIPYLVRFGEFIWGEIKSHFKASINLSLRISSKKILEFGLFLIPLTIFVMNLRIYGISMLIESARLGSPSVVTVSSSGSIFYNITENLASKLGFFNTVLQPLLYLPLLSIYVVPVIIYLLIAWYSNQTIYYDILTRQYTYLFAGFLFISLIYAIRKLKVNQKNIRKIAVLVMVSTLVSFALYSPFSIGNFQSGNVKYESTVTPMAENLTQALNLIPLNSSVLAQNDILQLMNRQQVYLPGYYNNQAVQYAVFAPSGQHGISAPYGGFSPTLGNQFANNKSYGLYIKLGNIEIYRLGYSGIPVMFLKEIISGKSTFTSETGISSNIITFSTPFTQLSPGYYNISFYGTTAASEAISPGNVMGNLTMLGSDGHVVYYNSTRVSLLENNSQLSFSKIINIENFDSYALNLQFSVATGTDIAYNGTTSYSITSFSH